MTANLLKIFNDFINVMKMTEGVLGAWNFGSALHGMSDEYSDVDIVFLIEENKFKEMELELPVILSKMCDEIVLCWEEDFNNNAIINNGYLLKKNSQIFQFDVFLLNKGCIEDFMCKVHYTDLKEKDIVFDVNNHVKKLCEDCPHGNLWNDNIERLITTYLYHFHMTAKYLIRQDYFKLNHVMRILYDTHVSILLTAYDAINWGGAENKLSFLSADKQEHLKKYFCIDDFSINRKNLLKSIEWFEKDINGILENKKMNYDIKNIFAVKEYWVECTVHV